jgi:hypothetical protein
VTDLERFAHRLASLLGAEGSDGIGRPVSVAELRGSLMPYRTNRTMLGVASSEDYELLVLRLIAEEAGLVRTSPAAAAEQAREEVASPNPNLDLLERLGQVTIQLDLGARETGAEGDARPSETAAAVDEPVSIPLPAATTPLPAATTPLPASAAINAPPPEVPLFESLERAPEPVSASPGACPSCSAELPAARVVIYCPSCGLRIGESRCPSCGTALEAGWRHCITCGRSTGPRG